jgi:hypothetical protein
VLISTASESEIRTQSPNEPLLRNVTPVISMPECPGMGTYAEVKARVLGFARSAALQHGQALGDGLEIGDILRLLRARRVIVCVTMAVTILVAASVPTRLAVATANRDLAGGLALGMFVPVGAAVVRERSDSTVRNRQILEEVKSAGVVANIPPGKSRRNNSVLSFAADRSAIPEELRMYFQFCPQFYPFGS